MFVPAGRLRRFTRVGHVAVFCPVCQDFRAASLRRDSVVWHVCFVPLPVLAEKTIGHEWTCETCGVLSGADIACFPDVHTRGTFELDALIARTLPTDPADYGPLLDMYEQVARGASSAEARAAFLRAPFEAFAPAIQRRGERVHLDHASAILLPLYGVAVAAGLWLVIINRGRTPAILAAIVLAAGIIAGLLTIAADHRRHLRRQVYPALARALARLRATPEEVHTVVASMRRDGNVTARRVSWRRLAREVQRSRE
jgi:hypothetical protein